MCWQRSVARAILDARNMSQTGYGYAARPCGRKDGRRRRVGSAGKGLVRRVAGRACGDCARSPHEIADAREFPRQASGRPPAHPRRRTDRRSDRLLHRQRRRALPVVRRGPGARPGGCGGAARGCRGATGREGRGDGVAGMRDWQRPRRALLRKTWAGAAPGRSSIPSRPRVARSCWTCGATRRSCSHTPERLSCCDVTVPLHRGHAVDTPRRFTCQAPGRDLGKKGSSCDEDSSACPFWPSAL